MIILLQLQQNLRVYQPNYQLIVFAMKMKMVVKISSIHIITTIQQSVIHALYLWTKNRNLRRFRHIFVPVASDLMVEIHTPYVSNVLLISTKMDGWKRDVALGTWIVI